MPATRDRVYQTSDLSGAARREFIDAGLHGRAYLRTPDGESLVLTRAAHLDLLADLRDHLVAYVMLDNALARPNAERRAADFGDWAFLAVFDDDGLDEFRTEVNDALMRAVSGEDVQVVESVLADWRRSARALNNPITRALVLGGVRDDADFVEVAGLPAQEDSDAGE